MPDEAAMPCGVAVFRIVPSFIPKTTGSCVPERLFPEESRIVKKRPCAEKVQVVLPSNACTIKVDSQPPPNANCGKMYFVLSRCHFH